MSLRLGSQKAIDFLAESESLSIPFSNREQWLRLENNYHQAIAAVAKAKETALKKKNVNLVQLDSYLRGEDFRESVLSRSPPAITRAELSDIVRWKLNRGKMRPLQALADGNSEVFVKNASEKAFKLLLKPNASTGAVKSALEEITVLHGIGPATASLVLALIFPSCMPFMADEVLDSVCGSRKYTLSEGVVASQRCRAIAHALGGSWTADRVGSCLWVCAMTAVYNIDIDLTSISIPIPSIAATATAAGNVVKSGSKAKTKAKIEVKSESKPSVKPSAKAKAKAKTKGKSKADTVPILEVKLEPEDGSCRREE